MVTYQDLIAVGERDKDRIDFVHRAIGQHKSTSLYKEACIAYDYAQHRNVTISTYQKLLYTMSGKAVPDNWSANYKLSSGFFGRFITQQTQFLLGNGITWEDEATAEALGDDFDIQLQKVGKASLWGGVAFGYFNFDHLEVFDVLEFAPLYDEENGALRAGIRFWQVDTSKPMRATLYEEDGITEYVWHKGKGDVLQDKKAYVQIEETVADEVTIYDGFNYPSFPIVPLFANSYRQNELVGIREQIDAYDLIKSGFANDLDDASQIYWIIQNGGGMDDVDLAKFRERLHTVKAAVVEDGGAKAEAHTIEVPYNARETILDRIEKDLYRDYMALDVHDIASGAVTATQIKAAYEPINSKADEWEYEVHQFIDGVLALTGIEDNPTFTRSKIVNANEDIGVVLQAAQYLDDDYVTEKILAILGDADRTQDMLKLMDSKALDRFASPEIPAGTGENIDNGQGT